MHRPLGAVLVGGASCRMGRDKAGLRWEGRTLASRAAGLLRGLCDPVVLSGGPHGDLPDLRPRQGPLAGLEAALAAAQGRDVFLLACDLPAVDRALVRRILDRPDSFGHDAAEARVAVDEEGLQPLCALYSSTCAPLVRNSLDRGERAARDLLAVLRVTAVEAGGQLVNLNTPDDWARWTAGSAGEHPAS
ncbi:MAG: molybdenum cofactor guanylyltransferase [Thermoanaerobaculia bacterium]